MRRRLNSASFHFYSLSRQCSATALAQALSAASEPVAEAAVCRYMHAPPAEKLSALKHLGDSLPSARDLERALSTAAASSASAMQFLWDVRSQCDAASAQGGASPQWSRTVDAACVPVLRMLANPQLVRIQQLSAVAQRDAALRAAAISSETVLRTSSAAEFASKFSTGRLVHTATHVAVPDVLLAALYSAVVPVTPCRMADIDAYCPPTDADSSNFGCWSLGDRSITDLSVPAAAVAPRSVMVFYSVSSPHRGSRGLRLGTRIIYHVASAAAAAAPVSLQTFCTLSPIPGFVSWLQDTLLDGKSAQTLNESECRATVAAAQLLRSDGLVTLTDSLGSAICGCATAAEGVLAALVRSPQTWFPHEAARRLLAPVLTRLCHRYLLNEQPPLMAAMAASVSAAASARRRPLCAVAAFHLSNGASMGRLCWGADPSDAGLARSASLMVNYVYSRTGANGLRDTMIDAAGRYAHNPGSVLAAQRPEIVDALGDLAVSANEL